MFNKKPKKPSLRDIINAFSPAKQIQDSRKFAGRKQHVKSVFSALMSEGTNLAIIGNRGIGKSSLATQLKNISTGDNTLLKKLQIPHDDKYDFLSIYLTCSNIKTFDDLLDHIITSEHGLNPYRYSMTTSKKEIDKSQKKGDLGVVKGSNEHTTEQTSELIKKEHNNTEIFINIIDKIHTRNTDGVLIIIDEFDQISNTDGFSNFLKALNTGSLKIKFCIVGVARDIKGLIAEHPSTSRSFSGGIIKLPVMENQEMTEIIRNAEKSINKYITFNQEAEDQVIKLANGHPYILHLIGKETLNIAYQKQLGEITPNIIEEALNNIATSGQESLLEERYKKAVTLSRQREVVLKSLAEQVKNGEVYTKDACRIAEERNVPNPSQYIGQLVKEKYGEEIRKLRRGYYSFNDSLFHTYVKARPYLYDNEK